MYFNFNVISILKPVDDSNEQQGDCDLPDREGGRLWVRHSSQLARPTTQHLLRVATLCGSRAFQGKLGCFKRNRFENALAFVKKKEFKEDYNT
jgi:hypothetical protein